VRNNAIDEIRRARTRDGELADDHADARDRDPAMILARKEAVRRMIEDLAELPDAQRRALVRNTLDGAPTDVIAAELGVSREATQMLIARARGGLVRRRDARDADCRDIRVELDRAGAPGARTSPHARGHLEDCASCRRYRRDLGRVDRRLRALLPPVWILPAIFGAKLGSAGAKSAAIGVAVAAAAAGGLLVLDRHTIDPGETSPLRLVGVAPYLGRSVNVGDPLPSGVALAYAKVELPAGPIRGDTAVALACPARSVVVGLATARELGFALSFDRPVTQLTRAVRVRFSGAPLSTAVRTRVALVCKRPDAAGSVVVNPRRLRAGERPKTVCATSSYVKHSPGLVVVGTVYSGEHVAARRRSASGAWTQITTESNLRGWLSSPDLCRAGELPTSSGRPHGARGGG
jgi:hypothetical protein